MINFSKNPPALLISLIIFCMSFSGTGYAIGSGSVENPTFSAAALGQAATGVAQANEPAAISYNPAGITQLSGVRIQNSVGFISMFTHMDGGQGDGFTSSGTISAIPTAYVTINPGKHLPGEALDDRITIGVGSDSPFGLANKFDASHRAVRYTGHVNTLKMFSVKPVLGVKVTDKLSVAAGPMWYRVFEVSQVSQYPNRLLQVFGVVPGPPALATLADGQARFDMSGSGWGWQLGARYEVNDKLALGYHFRSPVRVRAKGRVKVERAFVGGNFERGGYVDLNFPFNMTWGLTYKPNDRWTLNTDFGFTRWSTFNRLHVITESINAADDAIVDGIFQTEADYRNSFYLGVGGNYKLNDRWTLRAGSYFTWTPQPKTHFRPAIPDSNTLMVAIGVGYQVNKNLLLDIAYMNRFWLSRRIDNNISEILPGTTVDGTYFSYLQEFMFSVTYAWDFGEPLFESLEKSPEISV